MTMPSLQPSLFPVSTTLSREERIAHGKAIAMQHPKVREWLNSPHGLEGLVITNRAQARSRAQQQKEEKERQMKIEKAMNAYVKAWIELSKSPLDPKNSNRRDRCHKNLIRAIAGHMRRQHAYRAEIDSAMRRVRYHARKGGAWIL